MQSSIDIPVYQIDSETVAACHAVCASIFNNASGQLQDSGNTKRVTYNYGLDFFKMREGDFSETAIPDGLRKICGAALKGLEQRIGRELPDLSQYKNYIISLYQPGFKLQPHIDTDKNDEGLPFYFGEDIVGVVLQADPTGRLYFQSSADGLKPAFDKTQAHFLDEQDGMAYLLTDELRRFPNFHGVSEVMDRRISLTCRTVEIK